MVLLLADVLGLQGTVLIMFVDPVHRENCGKTVGKL